MGVCAGRPRLGHPHPRRRRPGRPRPPRVGDARGRTTHRTRGARCVGRRRPGDRREPVLPAPQPTGRGGGRRRVPGTPSRAAPSRPAVATGASRPPSPAAGRPGLGARDHQRPQPQGAGVAGHRRDDRLQHLRPRPARGAREATRDALGVGETTRLAAAADARAGAQERRRRHRTGRGGGRHLLAARPRRGRVRPRARTTGGPTRVARCSSARPTRAAPWATPTPRATSSCCPRRGRASATLRSSRRPIVARWPSARYPVAAELAAFGFRWFDAADASPRRPSRRGWEIPTRAWSSTTTKWPPPTSTRPTCRAASPGSWRRSRASAQSL